ncbi:MAG: PEP-CTERM sorting domain-containing protein [Pseudomonadota bacterium]
MLKSILKYSTVLGIALVAGQAQADMLVFKANSGSGINDCSGNPEYSCEVLGPTDIPNPVSANPNDDTLSVWKEVGPLTLASDLTVNSAAGGGTIISSGTTIQSYMLQFDSPQPGAGTLEAGIEFGSEVLGLITATGLLNATDSLLGAPGIVYETFNARGLEGNDVVDFGADMFSVDVFFRTTSPGDWVRVITAAEVSEPGSLALLATALVGVGLSRRKRR